jgi:2-oxoglutarate dehydrogenase E2 component (dihydrolipoamide succinyltransferase)
MRVDMVMPQMGESIAEATVSKWRKNIGDRVEKDEIILEISTDKVDSEIPSPASGTLVEITAKESDVVPVKTKIAVIETEAGAQASAPAAKVAVAAPAKETASASVPPAVAIQNGAAHSDSSSSDRFYSPLVRSLAEKHNIALAELDKVPGSGQGGRLNKEDFLKYVETRGSTAPASSSSARPAMTSQTPAAPAVSAKPAVDWGAQGSKVVVMDNMRSAIAEHMVRSKQTSPHVYSMQEVDCSAISKWRNKHRAEFEAKEGFKLSFTPFFLEAAVRGLVEFPYINASVDGKKIILHRHVNLGCAVALGNSGLIVPVIKRAEERNLVGIARGLNDLAMRARNKKLLPDDVSGGTFTVTNPGVFGTIIGTPIINQPQVAILCLGAIVKRAVVVDDMIAIREMCYLTLSYDHRIVDGSLGGQYLAFLREYIENWDSNRPLY